MDEQPSAPRTVPLRRLSHEEALDSFGHTLDEFVEALREYGPGEFVEAAVVEPFTMDDLLARLEAAAERLGWCVLRAPRAPGGTVRFRLEASVARTTAPRRRQSTRVAAAATTAPNQSGPPADSGNSTAPPDKAEPRRTRNAGASATEHGGLSEASAPAAEGGSESAPEDIDLEGAVEAAIARFGTQARETEIASWVRMNHPLTSGSQDLPERIRRVLRSSHKFEPAAKRGAWRLARSGAAAAD